MKNVEDIYLLSPMQKGMLFHSLLAPGAGLYVEQFTCTIEGELNAGAFRDSFRRGAMRHAILRSFFLWEGLEEPLQLVREQVELPWQELDWRDAVAAEQNDRFASFLQSDRQLGFELSRPPLARATLIRLGAHTFTFVFSYHHVLLDGWSTALLFKEVLSLYQASCDGVAEKLPPVRAYRDFIAWIQRQDTSKAEDFWRSKLSGFTRPTSLAVALGSHSRAATNTQAFAEEELRLSEELTQRLHAFSRSHQLTLSSLLEGAWAILLSRYTNEADVVFGATVSGRPAELAGAQSMIGLFINTLPVRVQVKSEERVVPFLASLQQQRFEAQQYEYASLVQVRAWSEVPDESLFDSILVFENQPADVSLSVDASGRALTVRNVKTHDQINYPLTALASPGKTLLLWLAYDCARFDAPTIKRMLGHWKQLLEGMSANANGRLFELPMLTKIEESQLLPRPNAAVTDSRSDYTLDQILEKQAVVNRDRIAISDGQSQLTYGALNAKANQLAHRLRRSGVGPESVVALFLERSAAAIISILGVLKAGGAYLPLDVNDPASRLQTLLADVKPVVLLTQPQLVEKLPAHAAEVICLSRNLTELSNESHDKPRVNIAPDNLAYIIYTSGSTGKPKGVMLTHHNVVRLLSATARSFPFNEQDVWTWFHSYSFDFSVWEIWGALSTGARIAVTPYWISRSPDSFYELLNEQQVTVLNQTPSAFQQLLPSILLTNEETKLRVVVFGGEALDGGSLKEWVQVYGSETPQLVNMYGITETTVHVTYRRLKSDDVDLPQRSMIGSAIADLQLNVLSDELLPLPQGVAGGMFIGGPGLGRGYWQRPDSTAERFIPNPYSPTNGDRLYVSGDIGRYQTPGDVEYVGRQDAQVKIRGFRLELGEIQSSLKEHESITEAAVTARSGRDGEKRLIAYVACRPHASVSVSELRGHLQARLPEYMVPAVFIVVDKLPLTANNKIDWRALPDPDGLRPELDRPYVAPRTPVEEELAQIWRELLGVDRVGIHDNFFELGGHSLLLTQLTSRVSEAFQVDVPLRVLFDTPTIDEITVAIAERLIEHESSEELSQLLDNLEELTPADAASMLAAEA